MLAICLIVYFVLAFVFVGGLVCLLLIVRIDDTRIEL